MYWVSGLELTKLPLIIYKVMTCCSILKAYILAEELVMFSWINPRLAEFSPNFAETGTRFLRGTRRSLHVFSRGNSHFMWRLKFSLRIDRITLTMLLLLSLSLAGREKTFCSVCCLILLLFHFSWSSRGVWLLPGQTDSKSHSFCVPRSLVIYKRSENWSFLNFLQAQRFGCIFNQCILFS